MSDYHPVHILNYLRQILLPLPAVSEKLYLNSPIFYVQKKIICRIREDGTTLVLYHHDRDKLLKSNPEVYFITEHYYNYPYVLVNLPLINLNNLSALAINAWKLRASKSQLKTYELQKGN